MSKKMTDNEPFWLIQQYNRNAKRKRFRTEQEARERAASNGSEWAIVKCVVVDVVGKQKEKLQ